MRVHFDLNANAARQALRDALDDEKFGRRRRNWSFQGEVLQRRITVHARWGFGRAEWIELAGAIVPAQDGSDFVGTIGWPRWRRWAGIVAWVVLAADLVFLLYLLWAITTGSDSIPHGLGSAVGPAVVTPIAAAAGLIRATRVRRQADPPTPTEALRQWLARTADVRKPE